ncbi:carboxy-terminal domain RNA polymerase II polypeptide A small phosphatase 2 isoform X1 [Arapaima gigas]
MVLLPRSQGPVCYRSDPSGPRQNMRGHMEDLEETLVHSSFEPISNATFAVHVKTEGTTRQMRSLCRQPFEQVLLAANVTKVPVVSWFDDLKDTKLLNLFWRS